MTRSRCVQDNAAVGVGASPKNDGQLEMGNDDDDVKCSACGSGEREKQLLLCENFDTCGPIVWVIVGGD